MTLPLPEFRLTSAHLTGDDYVVSLGGEFDLHTAPQLDEKLRRLINEHGARRIIVDLAGASFIDSTVLGVLLKTLAALRAEEGSLVLVSDDRRILRTFEVAGLERIFRIVPTLTEAVADLVEA